MNAKRPLKRILHGLKGGFRTLMPTCQQAGRLQSEALDRRLPLPRRLGLAIHMSLCTWCRRYSRQLKLIRRASRGLHEPGFPEGKATLSQAARERMRKVLREL